jgi:hypothetical protein
MSSLHVFWGAPSELSDAPIAAEILNPDLELVRSVVISGRGATLDVPPGRYVVRARLPSGETTRASVDVPTGSSAVVELKMSRSPHEWLSRQHFLGDFAQVRAPEEMVAALDAIQPQLWVFEDREWRPAEHVLPFNHDFDFSLAAAVYRVKVPKPDRLYLCQVESKSFPGRFVAVPVPKDGEVELLVRPARAPSPRNGGVSVKVGTRDVRTETLLHYLASGAVEAARTVADDALEPTMEALDQAFAEKLLRDKLENPFAAAIGGYFLLRIGAHERLHDWPNNFAEWIGWLPDAAVVHAWQMLRSPEGEPDVERIRARLLQAVRAGIPAFTEGMRLLVDGLDMCATDARAAGTPDDEVEEALAVIRRYASLTDWDQDVTTFYAIHPGSSWEGPRRRWNARTIELSFSMSQGYAEAGATA